MLSSTKKFKSTSNTSMNSSTGVKGKNENFLSFLYRRLSETISSMFTYSKKFMWFGSTGTHFSIAGLIIVLLPFVFAHFMEMQK